MSTAPPPENSATVPSAGRAFALEDLLALNEEIAALARAGMPMERGLLAVGRDVKGRMGAVATALGERMGRGESLPQALAAEGGRLPRVYRAAVEAGLKAGHLPAALEGLAGYTRAYAETRAAIGLAFLYPLYVLVMAYGLLVCFAVEIGPRLALAFTSLQLPASRAMTGLARLGDSVIFWGPVLPVVLLLLGMAWAWSGRASGFRPGRIDPLRWVPWMGGMLANARASAFAGLLAVLVEHKVPLPEGIELASEASGDPRLAREGRAMAEALRRGDSLGEGLKHARAFPPLLRWLMLAGMARGALAPALRHASETYRHRALDRAEAIRLLLPSLLLLAVGGTAALVYGLTLFVPLSTLLNNLAVE